jgi:hypothetical protein
MTTPDPRATVFDLIFGRWRSQILYAGVKLGIFDALGDGPKRATAIAQELELDSALSYRLLRALGSLGLLKEHSDRTFSLAEAGELLRKNHPRTLRGVTLLAEGPEHYALWKHLPAMIRDGKQNAFVREFGRLAFDHAAHNPGYAEVFNDAMSSYSTVQTEWALQALDGFDFSSISHVCDVGGGQGYMLCSFLVKYPHLTGTVLEMPAVIEDRALLWADKLNVGDRCRYIDGDMFVAVPHADAYMLKMILHDWNDQECVQILRNVHKAAPQGGRVFIVEYIIPDADTSHFAKLYDIHMMCWGTGRERTVDEYAALLQEAGWKYVETWFPPSKAMGAVEGMKL